MAMMSVVSEMVLIMVVMEYVFWVQVLECFGYLVTDTGGIKGRLVVFRAVQWLI